MTVRRRDAGRPRGAPVIHAVLAAVRAELAERGAEGLSVERVAARAEVNKTSVYRRWPTREALVAAAMEGLLDDLSTDPDNGDVRSDLLALVTPIAELAARPDGAALLRAAVAQGPGEVSRLATRRLEAGVRPIPGLAARAAARGQWRPGVDPGQVVLLLVGAIMHRVLLEGADPTGAWLEGVVDLTVTGLLPRPGDG